jgi:hypothetical protein
VKDTDWAGDPRTDHWNEFAHSRCYFNFYWTFLIPGTVTVPQISTVYRLRFTGEQVFCLGLLKLRKTITAARQAAQEPCQPWKIGSDAHFPEATLIFLLQGSNFQ